MTRPSWVPLHGMAHRFIELDKAVVHVIRSVIFLRLWFQSSHRLSMAWEWLENSDTNRSGHGFLLRTPRTFFDAQILNGEIQLEMMSGRHG